MLFIAHSVGYINCAFMFCLFHLHETLFPGMQKVPSILSVSSSIRSRTISSPANMALARRTAGSINSLSSRRDHHSDDNISGRDTGCCGDSAVHDQDVKDTCFKEGELFVQGSKLLKKFQSKKTAYFCLYGRGPHSRARLVQYSSQKASKNKRYEPEVMIPASDVVLVESIDDYDQGYMFTILCRDNKLFLSTENEILRTEWIEALTDKLIHDCESPTSKHFCSADTSCSDIGPMSGNFQVRVHEDVKKYFGDDSPVNLVVENKTISIVTPNGLCLAKWPLDKLRKYGFVEDQNYFFVETGRQAQHGDAVFKFHTNQGKEIHQVVKNNKKYGVTSNSNQSLVPAVTFDPELAFSTNLYDQLPTTNPVQKPNADEENNVKLLFPVHPNKAVMQNSEASTRCSSKIDQNSSETESQRGPHGKSSVQSMIHGVEETSYLYTIPDVTKKSKPGNFNTETSPDIYTLPDISNKSKLMVTKKSKSGILNTETPPDIYALPDISNKSKQTVSSAEAIPPVYSIVTSKKSMKKIPSTPSKEYMTLSSTNTEISISQPVDKTVPVSNLNRSLVKSSPIYASPVELNVRKMGPLPIPPSAALKNNTKIKTAEPKLPEASVRNIKFSPQHVYENTSLLRITPTFSMTRKPDPPIIDSPPKSPRSYVQ